MVLYGDPSLSNHPPKRLDDYPILPVSHTILCQVEALFTQILLPDLNLNFNSNLDFLCQDEINLRQILSVYNVSTYIPCFQIQGCQYFVPIQTIGNDLTHIHVSGQHLHIQPSTQTCQRRTNQITPLYTSILTY